MTDQERSAEKVAARDRALLAIRQADAFLVVTTLDSAAGGELYADDYGQIIEMSEAARKLKKQWILDWDERKEP